VGADPPFSLFPCSNSLRTLASIERFANKEISRGLIMRIIMHKSDLGKIQEFRERLRQSLDIFGVGVNIAETFVISWFYLQLKSNITIQENLSHIVSQQGEILHAFQRQDARIDGARDETPVSNVGDFVGPYTDEYSLSRTPSHDTIPVPPATSLPRHLRPAFPHVQSSRNPFAITSIGGDHNVVDSSRHVTSTNSGNTTTTTTTNSNNDSSVRIRGRAYAIPFFNLLLPDFGCSLSWPSENELLKRSSIPFLRPRLECRFIYNMGDRSTDFDVQ
jgi:hypothetical protein